MITQSEYVNSMAVVNWQMYSEQGRP